MKLHTWSAALVSDEGQVLRELAVKTGTRNQEAAYGKALHAWGIRADKVKVLIGTRIRIEYAGIQEV